MRLLGVPAQEAQVMWLGVSDIAPDTEPVVLSIGVARVAELDAFLTEHAVLVIPGARGENLIRFGLCVRGVPQHPLAGDVSLERIASNQRHALPRVLLI
jgi:hypothetical protein